MVVNHGITGGYTEKILRVISGNSVVIKDSFKRTIVDTGVLINISGFIIAGR